MNPPTGYAAATTTDEARVLRTMLQRLGCDPAVVDQDPVRPQLRELLAGLQPDQVLLIADLPSLGTSATEIAARLSKALDRRATVYLLEEGIDTGRDGLAPLVRALGELGPRLAGRALQRADAPDAYAPGRDRRWRYTDAEVARYWQMRDEGMSWRAIGGALGQNGEKIRQLCKRRGRPSSR